VYKQPANSYNSSIYRQEESNTVSIPLNLLVDREVNTYEMTCLAIQNAARLTKNGDKDIEEHGDKVVSASLFQVLNDQVEYESSEEE
jgi:hypothetical protein